MSNPELWAKLEELEAVKILYSEWLIADEIGQAVTIYDAIAPCIREKDRLLVQEVMKDAAWDRLLISDEAFRKLLIKFARG